MTEISVDMRIIDQKTSKIFSQAYILGGSPCSGKSTIAERLSKDFKLQYYKVDDHEQDHSEQSDPNCHPIMHQYRKMSWNEIWMRSVDTQVKEEFDYFRERFEMIVQDLKSYDSEKPIILEGAAYLPELLKENKADPRRVIFLVPTIAFQLRYCSQRPWIKHILKECKDPEQAFENWMMRDHLFGKEILQRARVRNYKTILVNGKQDVDEQYTEVKEYFGFK